MKHNKHKLFNTKLAELLNNLNKACGGLFMKYKTYKCEICNSENIKYHQGYVYCLDCGHKEQYDDNDMAYDASKGN